VREPSAVEGWTFPKEHSNVPTPVDGSVCGCDPLIEAKKRAEPLGKLKHPRQIYAVVAPEIAHLTHEEFYVLGIGAHGNLDGKLVCYQRIAHGGQHVVHVENEQIAQALLKDRPDLYFICHNHPSGDSRPSPQDEELTKSIRKGMAVACPKIVFGDHLVVTPTEFYSFQEEKVTKV